MPRPTSRKNRYEVLLHREATQRIWPADWFCGALGVSHGGFYARLQRPRIGTDDELGVKVRARFLASDRTYGARRVWRDVPADGALRGDKGSKHVRAGVGRRPIWVSGKPP
jgi:hypothetical protein